MTTAEYLRTPETVLPQELIYGKLRVADAPFVPHQRLVGDLLVALHAHVQERRLGEVLLSPMDVILDGPKALIVQPDLLYVSSQRSDIVHDHVWGAPDLVVEILSPHPRIGTLNERVRWFAEYGVRECWLVHQFDRRVEVLRFEAGHVADRASLEPHQPIISEVLPAFRATMVGIAGW